VQISFENNAVTSDRERYERNRGFLLAQPFLRIYGPTFGWLGAAFARFAGFTAVVSPKPSPRLCLSSVRGATASRRLRRYAISSSGCRMRTMSR